MRRIALCLIAAATLGSGAACGGDDAGPQLTQEAFVQAANAICKEGDAKLAEKGKDLLTDPNTPADKLT